MQNAYCYNPDINVNGSALNDWITGSAAVLMKIIFSDIFGIIPDYQGINIDPLASNYVKSFQVKLNVHNKELAIDFHTTGSRSLLLNGKQVDESYISYEALLERNTIQITR